MLIKLDNVKEVYKSLNKFDKDLRFTVDAFQNKVSHFLDLELSPDRVLIFRKVTNTGLYADFTSFEVLFIRLTVNRGLKLWLLVHHVFVYQINFY